jgi:hypothetical protein
MRPDFRPYAAVGLAAGAISFLWPLSPALPAQEAASVRILALVTSALVCLGMALAHNRLGLRRAITITGAAVAMAAGIALVLVHYDATGSCIANYNSQPRVIGRILQPYVKPEPGSSPETLLFDAAGVPESVWTPSSIRSCRWRLGWVGLAAIPAFAFAACCLMQGLRPGLLFPAAASKPPVSTGEPCRFDVFFSYRHTEPDRGFALELLRRLEECGFRAAIDERDFRPNEHFLSEMERCIKQSRYVLCVITPRYVASDHCVEEAVLSKTLDLSERTRRIIPLILEPVELPVWLHQLVGINFTEDAAVDPFEKLRSLLATV